MILACERGARRDAEPLQRRQHVVDDDHRRGQPAERRQLGFGDDQQRRRRPRSPALAKSWPSSASPLMAKKASPGSSVRRVDGNAGDALRHRARAAGRRMAATSRSVVHSRLMRHAPRSAFAHLVMVGERQGLARRSSGLPHGPCRRRSACRRPAAWRPPRGSPRAGRRSRWRRARRPGSRRGSSAGTSERGLSSVTMTTSASRVAISPMIGRLPRSRSPPQPNTTTTRPVVNGRTDASTFSSASGLWA